MNANQHVHRPPPPKRRRPARRLNALGMVPGEQMAAAMDELADAQALFEDLVALIDAGRINTVDHRGTARCGAGTRAHTTTSPDEPVNDRRCP